MSRAGARCQHPAMWDHRSRSLSFSARRRSASHCRDPWDFAIERGGRPAERLSYFGGIWHHAHWHSLCVCVQSIQQAVFEGGMGLFVQV